MEFWARRARMKFSLPFSTTFPSRWPSLLSFLHTRGAIERYGRPWPIHTWRVQGRRMKSHRQIRYDYNGQAQILHFPDTIRRCTALRESESVSNVLYGHPFDDRFSSFLAIIFRSFVSVSRMLQQGRCYFDQTSSVDTAFKGWPYGPRPRCPASSRLLVW